MATITPSMRRVFAVRRARVVRDREETNAIASNQSFSGWTRTFTDPRLCAAIIDRLTVAGNILATGTTSCRLAHARSATAH